MGHAFVVSVEATAACDPGHGAFAVQRRRPSLCMASNSLRAMLRSRKGFLVTAGVVPGDPERSRPADVVDRLWIVDGALIPVRGPRIGASLRNYCFSVNVQVIIDADTNLVIATARPVPGDTVDAKGMTAPDSSSCAKS